MHACMHATTSFAFSSGHPDAILPLPKFTDLPKTMSTKKELYWTRLNDVMLRHCICINNVVAEVHKMTHGIFFCLFFFLSLSTGNK